MYEREILEVYRYCNVRSFPIDCESIVAKLGYQMVAYQQYCERNRDLFKNLCSISNDSFIIRRKRLMFINSSVDRRRKRFSICHEIGHIVMLTDDEDEADRFASSILAPLPMVTRYGFDCDTICKIFNVSVAMANRIITDHRGETIIDDEGILDYFDRCAEEDAKKRYELRMKRHRRRAVPITDQDELRLAKHDLDLFFY